MRRSTIRPGWTAYRRPNGNQAYHGALRTELTNTLVWKCDHEHFIRSDHGDGALACALEELTRRSDSPAQGGPA